MNKGARLFFPQARNGMSTSEISDEFPVKWVAGQAERDHPTRERRQIRLYGESDMPMSLFMGVEKLADGRYLILIEPSIYDTRLLQSQVTELNHDLGQLTRHLQKTNTDLAHLNNVKNEFLGMAAHDLRTPIANIASFSELALLEPENLSPENQEYLEHIRNLARFMLNMLNGLLDLTQIESGQLHLKPEALNINEVLADSVHLHQRGAWKNGLVLKKELTEDLPEIQADKTKLTQVANNLIGNAIKYSPDGSQVVVRSRLHPEGRKVEFEVEDNGPGMDQADIEAVIHPFQTGKSKNMLKDEKSFGLGLAICRKIVRAHKGQFEIDSEPGRGSRFLVRLPLGEARESTNSAD